MRKLDDATRAKIQKEIDKNLAKLKTVRGFLGAEPGFPIVDGWIRKEPAILVFVSQKLAASHLLVDERVPRRLGAYRVDVLQADPLRQIRAKAGFAELQAALDSTDQDAALAGLTYQKMAGNPIDKEFQIEKPILCHVGPDSGWTVLEKFIEGTKEKLTVAMYDFNAEYLANTLIKSGKDNELRVRMTLDAKIAPDEQTIVDKVKKRLKTQFEGGIVVNGGSRRFPTAYREKVAVQDSKAFWLSSGNWSRRSQPEIDPIDDPATAKGMYSAGNREWHIIVKDAPLAKLYEKYIDRDYDESIAEDTALGGAEPIRMPDLFVPLSALMEDDAALAAPEPVAPQLLPEGGKKVRVQPLLSPDNYADRIEALIKSAKSSLYLQYSYITYSTAAKDKQFQRVLDYIATLSYKEGFDLKIIVGNDADKVRKYVEAGLNDACIRTQSPLHNKAIIVDHKAALVSSQNWSGDGFLRNRDAGLIMYDADIAAYFESVFMFDWDSRAKAQLGAGLALAQVAGPDDPTPPGMVRMSWNDYYGE